MEKKIISLQRNTKRKETIAMKVEVVEVEPVGEEEEVEVEAEGEVEDKTNSFKQHIS